MNPIVKLATIALILIATALAVTDNFDDAQRQFDKHNYKAALAILDRLIGGQGTGDSEAADRPEWLALRARCLLKLGRGEEGLAAMEVLFNAYPEYARKPELHREIAEGLLPQRLGGGAIRLARPDAAGAIKHLRKAYEFYLEADDKEGAAGAAIACGEAFAQFSEWDKLDWVKVEAPADWQAEQALRRRFALEWIDRGLALTTDPATASAATFRKGNMLSHYRGSDPEAVDRAIAVYKDLIERWPESKEAPDAALGLGNFYEYRGEDYVSAVEWYRKVVERYPRTRSADQARRQVEAITRPVVSIVVEGPVLPGESAALQLHVRNVKRVDVRAYRIDLFEFVRNVDHPSRLEEWSPRGDAAAVWSVDIPDTGDHKNLSTWDGSLQPARVPELLPGAYVLRADAGSLDSDRSKPTALLVVSRLASVSKGGRDGGFVWTVDAVTGQPRGGVEVLVQEQIGADRFEYYEGRTDVEGMYRVTSGRRKGDGDWSLLMIVARDGDHYAACSNSYHWFGWAFPQGYRAYTFTDRPVYRPDQPIHFKHVLRSYDGGEYVNAAGVPISMTVRDPKGQTVEERTLTTNEHGSVSGEILLSGSAPLGMYGIQLEVGGRYVDAGAGANFRVEEYRKPEFEVTVSADRSRYASGEPVDVRIEARYYFGSPVAEAKLTYTVHRAPIQRPYRYPVPYPWYFEQLSTWWRRSEERRVGKECRSRWSPYH